MLRSCRNASARSAGATATDEFISLYEEVVAESRDRGAPDSNEEGLAAATYLRELLLSIKEERAAFSNSNTFRFKESLRRVPMVGRLSLTLAQRLAGKPTKKS
jgi:hypothetical protein